MCLYCRKTKACRTFNQFLADTNNYLYDLTSGNCFYPYLISTLNMSVLYNKCIGDEE